MLLLVGLGNPGPRYANNRHNVGFMALEAIARRQGFGSWRRRFQGEVAEGHLGETRVVALKPMTYMNESGRSVGEALRFYKLAAQQVLVLHDELDLAPGKVKLKRGGGHAGHNGLRSIIAHIGADFRRLRLGIGHPGDKTRVQAYVLSDFAKSEQPVLERLLEAVAAESPLLADNDARADGAFMSKVNQAVFPPRSRPARPSVPDSAAAAPGHGPETNRRDREEGLLARALRRAAARLSGSGNAEG